MIGRLFGRSDDDPPTEADYSTLSTSKAQVLHPPDGLPNALRIRPDEDHDGIDAALRLLQGLHDARSRRGKNISTSFAFEIRRIDGRVSFQMVPGDPTKAGSLRTQLETAYPGAEISEEPAETLPLPSDTERHVSGGHLKLGEPALYPIKHLEIEGFDADPYNSVIQAMCAGGGPEHARADVLVQVVMRPCLPGWTDGPKGEPSIDDIAHNLKQPNYETKRNQNIPLFRERVEHEPSAKEKKAAKIVRNLRNEDGWSINVRVVTVADEPPLSRDRTHNVSRMFRSYYESSSGQGFVPVPCSKRRLTKTLSRVSSRGFEPRDILLSRHELAGVVHLPNDEVPISAIERTHGSVKRGVPIGTPRFDYQGHGLDPAVATPTEKQVTMCSVPDPEAPIWYGTGVKHGVEAGVFASLMDTHQFVGGSTGKGKTTLLKNFWRQVLERKHGALFVDPKGRDAEAFVDLVPEQREEDLVYIEVGGERERSVGFNFLEPSGKDVDHGTARYVDAVEAVAEDLAAVLAEAGDAEGTGQWGTRMDRITKNVVRGMARAPEPLTILDMHYALGSEEQRQRYASMLAEEQIDWIQDYAQNHLAKMSDDDLEPLAGRLNQLVENDITRNMISVRESTVSIEDVVRDGKIVVVRNLTTSETAKRLITTALIRRLWVAVREQSYADHCPDPPPFFGVIDEFDSVVSERSRIDSILSEARAFGLCFTLACQNPSDQLPESVNAAIQNQCETFLTFNPGGPSDARLIAKQHSQDISDEDLLDLAKYRIMLRTHTDAGELTHSYQAQAFPPLEEQAAEAGLDDRIRARTGTEREQLIDEALERYGARRRSSEEIKRDTRFYNGAIDGDEDGAALLDDADGRTTLYKAIYDAQIRHGADPTEPSPIDGDQLQSALRPTIADLTDTTPDAVSEGMIHSVTDQLTRDGRHLTETDDYQYYVGPDGLSFLNQDEPEKADPRAGKRSHRRGVDHAYRWSVHTMPDCEVTIPDQGGEESDLRITDPATFDGSGLAVDKQRQQFRESNPLRAVLTGGNDVRGEFEHTTKDKRESLVEKVQRAYDDAQACLFYCWSIGDAEKIHWQLEKPESKRDLPDDAHWHTVVLPGGIGAESFDQPHLYLGRRADPQSIPFSDVSPDVVQAAIADDGTDKSTAGIDVSDI